MNRPKIEYIQEFRRWNQHLRESIDSKLLSKKTLRNHKSSSIHALEIRKAYRNENSNLFQIVAYKENLPA